MAEFTLTVDDKVMEEDDNAELMNNAFKMWIKWALTVQTVELRHKTLGVVRRGNGTKNA